MQQPPQEIHAYGYSAGAAPAYGVGVVPAASDASPRPDQPPHQPPPPRRRLSPFRIFILAFIGACAIAGVVALLVWLIYRPSRVQVAVHAATLSRFLVNSTAAPPVLSFNLTAGLIITNPNRRVGVYYDLLHAEGVYRGQSFDRITLPMSFQAADCADRVRAVLEGTSAVAAGVSVVALGVVGDDDQAAVFNVDLWLDGKVRYRYGGVMTTSASTLSVKCPLVLQLMVPSRRVECTVACSTSAAAASSGHSDHLIDPPPSGCSDALCWIPFLWIRRRCSPILAQSPPRQAPSPLAPVSLASPGLTAGGRSVRGPARSCCRRHSLRVRAALSAAAAPLFRRVPRPHAPASGS
ncbi:hypothetical protein D1007_27008 [Hordeum vulgare]|nr:hypothetical protein D1007_27008 [Hordeum vulgare]